MGLGALIAGLLLTMIHYPTAAENVPIPAETLTPVSYTHLDVYKRQP